MMKVIKYPSIGQFRNLVKDIQFAYKGALPAVRMVGTVKVHGTNASVVITGSGDQYPQSRSNIISVGSDNMGFAAWHHGNRDLFRGFADKIRRDCELESDDTIVIYGEWAGKGIQRGVAVSDVDKFFYAFGVKVILTDDSEKWLKDYPLIHCEPGIIDSRMVWVDSIEIDFNSPQSIVNTLVDITNNIEHQCPVGKFFGVEGVGEGVVWRYIDDKGNLFQCKVKGEKHSSSKVKKLAEVDTEKLNSVREFVDYAVTENRMSQGFKEVCNDIADRKMLGKFIKWVSTDVVKEESDTLAESGLCMKDVGGALSRKAKDWFFAKELI
jgi:hypothetical protein